MARPYSITVLVLVIAAASLDDVSARRLVGGGKGFHHVDDNSSSSHQILIQDEPPLLHGEDEESAPTNDLPPPVVQEPISLIASQFSTDPHAHRDRFEMIKTGELGLAGLRYMSTSFSNTNEGDDDDTDWSYNDVYGDFCVFEDNGNQGKHCGEHRYKMPLQEVMSALENDDSSNNNIVQTLPLSGMLFHQGYSGAGLIANALSTLDSTLVISDQSTTKMLHEALSACDVIRNQYNSDDCSSTKQQRLVQDVITLLSRTTDANKHYLFLKLDSGSAAYLPTLRALYPNAKWTFSYRNNVEETLSKSMQRHRNVVCTKGKRNPSMALVDKTAMNHLDLEQLSHFQVCALHLVTLWEAAVREHEESGSGMLVSYDDIIVRTGGDYSVIIDGVLPYLGLQKELDSDYDQVVEKITEVLSWQTNSKRGSKDKKKWDPSQEVNIEISDEVRDTVKVFMGDLMGES